MKDNKSTFRYEKPELLKYGFFGSGIVVKGASPVPGGDIPEECDTEFDE